MKKETEFIGRDDTLFDTVEGKNLEDEVRSSLHRGSRQTLLRTKGGHTSSSKKYGKAISLLGGLTERSLPRYKCEVRANSIARSHQEQQTMLCMIV